MLDLRHREVFALGVGEVPARHRRPRPHGVGFGELHADGLLDIQQLPQGALLGVLRASRITRRRTDAPIVLANKLLVAEGFVGGIAPVHLTHLLVQVLGKRLGQTVAHRLNEDGVVVVVIRLVGPGDSLLTDAAGHREGADPVRLATLFRRNIVRQTVVGEALLLALLTQVVQHFFHFAARFVAVDLDAVPHRIGREQAYDAGAAHALILFQLIQHGVGIGKQPGRLLTNDLVFEDARKLARQLPAEEERRPVDVGAQHRDGHVLELLHTRLARLRRLVASPVQLMAVGARLR